MKKLFKNKPFIISLILIILIAGIGIFAFLKLNNKETETNKKQNKTKIKEPVKEVSIVDLDSKSRPYAVMINNHPTARKYHAGLQDAYIVYELIVEGGLTRYMALFKDQETDKIGSVRSSRHYFLDYAMENDAYYVHWGWSPQAQSDISTYKINNINGLTYEGTYFYRDKSLGISLEHTGFTNMEMLKKAVEKLKYRTETNKELLLKYSADSVDYSELNNVIDANNVSIKYSGSIVTSYQYDSVNKVYKRFVNDAVHKDHVTGNQYTAKNIITYQVSNSTISGDAKGRQEFNNVGSGTGYLITEGKAIPIKWSKKSRSEQTIYTYEDGTKIEVNDGNTFIQIQPTGQTLTIN